MADTSTIASLATAGGTLILAVATFSSTRSANRAARISEQALNIGLRPLLFNARAQDPPQKVGFIDDHWLVLRDGLAAAQESDGSIYLAMPLRNVASGMAVLHGWHLWTADASAQPAPQTPPPVDDFRRLQRDLYVPAGDISFWQAAVRDRDDPLYEPLLDAIRTTPGLGSTSCTATTRAVSARSHASRSRPVLTQTIRSHGCACAQPRATGTWIAPIRAEPAGTLRGGSASGGTRTAAHHAQPDDLAVALAHIRLLLVNERTVRAAAVHAPADAHRVLDRRGLRRIDTLDVPLGMLEPSPQDLFDAGGILRLPDSARRHRAEVDCWV